MKWTVAPLPRDGDVRVVKEFAFVPVRLTRPPNTMVWLERYRRKEKYTAYVVCLGGFWTTTEIFQ